MIKVKIINSGMPTYWYAGKIGEIFEVETIEKTLVAPGHMCYIVAGDPLHGSFYIDFEDAVQVDICETETTIDATRKYYGLSRQELSKELYVAEREAKSLAMILWAKFYKETSPNFELCDSVAGIISQIDNMVSQLVLPD